MSADIDYYRQQIIQARTEIRNLRQQLSSLKNEHLKEIKLVKNTLNGLRCADCATKKATTIVNVPHGDGPSSDTSCITYRQIGVIETAFHNKRAVPRQTSVLAKAKGTVVIDTNVFSNPEHALSGLEEFSHIWVIFHFHTTESNSVMAKVAPPRLGGERRGVFSTRSPHRPCPIGLSLVKIDSIEGNKIHFLGVDMVNGTPVLDVKPYIPQYDYPTPQFTNPISLVRPPTEGTSDGTEALASLQIDDQGFDARSSAGTTSPLNQSPFDQSPENEHSALLTPVSPSPESPISADGAAYNARVPASRPDSERGAPDGQERFTPPQSAPTNVMHDGIRVAPWVSQPPSQIYEVRFTKDALDRLNDLIGNRAPAFKSTLETLLSEDPRSLYVRTRYANHEYNCVLEDLSISCVFDISSSVCTILAVRSAEDL